MAIFLILSFIAIVAGPIGYFTLARSGEALFFRILAGFGVGAVIWLGVAIVALILRLLSFTV